MAKKKYEVSVVVDGRFFVEVEAENASEAKEKAIKVFEEADVGDIECVDWFVQHAEGEDGEWKSFI